MIDMIAAKLEKLHADGVIMAWSIVSIDKNYPPPSGKDSFAIFLRLVNSRELSQLIGYSWEELKTKLDEWIKNEPSQRN